MVADIILKPACMPAVVSVLKRRRSGITDQLKHQQRSPLRLLVWYRPKETNGDLSCEACARHSTIYSSMQARAHVLHADRASARDMQCTCCKDQHPET